MDTGNREWDLLDYFQIFFPSYIVTVTETGEEPRRITLSVSTPENQSTASYSAHLTDFVDICSMADIAASLRAQLHPGTWSSSIRRPCCRDLQGFSTYHDSASPQ